MVLESVAALPRWLLVGLALGASSSVLVAAIFVAGERMFPAAARAAGPRIDGTDRRREEIREYLGAIGESFAEDHPVAGHEVAFYLPERDVAVTFDAHAFFAISGGTDTFCVLCEHEMPGHHLSARLPFETPDVEYGPDEGVDSHAEAVRGAFRTLGLPTDADGDAVKSAYREQVKEVHPDHGGDEESFKRVQEAYTVAKEHAG